MFHQGIFLIDEPESALSAKRQLDLVRILSCIQMVANPQLIVATHSLILMALLNALVLEVSRHGITALDYRYTQHFKLSQSSIVDPQDFIAEAIRNNDNAQF